MDLAMGDLDSAIRAVYEEFQAAGHSVDDILVDPDIATDFARRVNLSRAERTEPTPVVLRRLIGLRKIGEEKGGLPRGERRYFGRRAAK